MPPGVRSGPQVVEIKLPWKGSVMAGVDDGAAAAAALLQLHVSDSGRPHRWQPTRLPRPWGAPGKNTGVGCHCLLQCMKVKSDSEVAQSCPTFLELCSLMGISFLFSFAFSICSFVSYL